MGAVVAEEEVGPDPFVPRTECARSMHRTLRREAADPSFAPFASFAALRSIWNTHAATAHGRATSLVAHLLDGEGAQLMQKR